MKKTLILIILSFLFLNVKSEISLNIQLLSETDSSINILITATNLSETDSVLFYKFDTVSFCGSILNIDFIGVDSEKRHEYFPCSWIDDIDRIILRKENSILLLPEQSYEKEFVLKLVDISPFLENDNYFIESFIDYENGNFESEMVYDIFKGYSKSNRIEISNRK